MCISWNIQSKSVKAFINRHGNDNDSTDYDLQSSDILEASYHKFVHKNRAVLAARVRECWSDPAVVKLLPERKILVAAGPDESEIKLEKNCPSTLDYMLQSDHVEADTRMLLHAQVIRYDDYKTVVIQANDTDVIILSIAHGLSTGVDNLYIKSFNTMTKIATCINPLRIAQELKRKFSVDPTILLVIHALSGCDTTSFVRNITKSNFFRTYFNNYKRFSHLNEFFTSPLSNKAVVAAEQLLLACYPSSRTQTSLDELRGIMAVTAFKQSHKIIAANLPPTFNAFYHHCLHVARQTDIWCRTFEPYLNLPPLDICNGFTKISEQV
ncbi:unnamed protein product [Didymodactylos carnosus]|uniref:Uncharacterized protein n=1 Tax=Didymodactylos carnosus TaxID=1234261 RepID=A0A814E383_9BILA|nr:unnamed protein product [Didymodactylos carnosus]CAF3737550.1 unnamed protein product [Didymodactylos carnosus]